MFWCIDPNVYFTLEFYGTSNTKSKKELQIWVRCWSENEKKIVSRHLITYFLGHATGEIWFEHLIKALDTNSLRLEQVLTLGRDGTNTNKKVVRLCQEKLKGLGLKLLFDSGSIDWSIFYIEVFVYYESNHKNFINDLQTSLL